MDKIFNKVLDKIADSKRITSDDVKKIAKGLKKGEVKVDYLNSLRSFSKGSNGSYIDEDAKVSLDPYAGNTTAKIASTAVAKARWKDGIAYITFTTNPNKEYAFDVDEQEFKSFMDAPSKGRHVNKVWKVHNRMKGY